MKPERQEFRGRLIEVRPGRDIKEAPELFIDKRPVRYGRLPDGSYFLDEYAYDWTDDLMELGRRYVAYQLRVAAAREAGVPRKET